MSLKLNRARKALQKRIARGFNGYPVGTLAYYGETDQRASKAVVSIVRHDGGEPGAMKKFFAHQGEDLRADGNTLLAIVNYFREYNPASVAFIDRVIGCPHEEGIDYPRGGECPRCEFWRGRNRLSDQGAAE